MKKWLQKSYLILLAVFLVFVMSGCGSGQQTSGNKSAAPLTGQSKNETNVANGEQVVIKIADSLPNSNLIAKYGTIPWIERIEELGKGKIKVEYYPAEQLGKAASLLDVAKNGVADITYVAPLYISDKMPLSGVSGNPGIVKDALSGSKAFHKLVLEDLYEVEFKRHGVKPLWGAMLSPSQIVTSKHPVKTIEEFKGLKIRTAGGLQEKIMQAWGAVNGQFVFITFGHFKSSMAHAKD